MAILDIIILVILTLGFLHGWRTGFIIQLSSLASIILAFVFAALLMKQVGAFAVNRLGVPEGLGPFVGFVATFLVIRLCIHGFLLGVKAMMSKFKLSGLDKATGGVAGSLKSAVLLSLAFLVLGFANVPSESVRRTSELYQPMYRLVPDAWRVISNSAPAFEELRDQVEERLDMARGSVPV